MAFTGTAVVQQITDRMVRITGLSLGIAATGTIGLAGATGSAPDVHLPAAFKPVPYTYKGATVVSLQESIKVDYAFVASDSEVTCPAIAKTGTDNADFRISVTNTHSSASPGIEFYIQFHE